MAEKQFGGWYPNPTQGGENMRWWGDFGWTTGSDPTGGQGPKTAPSAPITAGGGASTPSGGLWSQYQERLAPITQESEGLLKDYLSLSAQGPTFAQKLLDSIKQAGQYPSQAEMRAEYMKNPNLTPSAIEGLVSRRGQTGRGTIQDLISRATGGFEAEIESRRGAADLAQTRRSNLLEEYGFEYGAQQDVLDRKQTGRGTSGERARSSALNQAKTDASQGATSEQLARAYGSTLEPWEILQIYNDKGLYGPIENLQEQFYKWLPGTEDQTSSLRNDLVEDIRGDINAGMSREQSIKENRAIYPELSNDEFNKLYEALWEGEEEGSVDFSKTSFGKNLLKTRVF